MVENQKNLLIICGVSGSGKSTLEANLIKEYPEYFNKWMQMSTRKMRDGEFQGSPYVFVSDNTFDQMKANLVGRIGLSANSMYNKDKYGSIPDFVNEKVSTVILATEGLNDILESIKSGHLEVDNYFILGLDVDYSHLEDNDFLREGRDKSFIEKEKEVLKYANNIFKLTNGRYLEPTTVVVLLKNYKML